MTIEQIIKLSDIGFTADEIKQLSNGGEIAHSTGTNPTGETAGTTTGTNPTGETAGTTTGTKPAETAAFSEAVNALMAEISGLKKTIQATNILNSNAGKEEPESVDTILQNFMKGANK